MSKILITGASGFLNSNLTRRMLQEGHEVALVLRKNSHLERIKDIYSRVKIMETDLCDFDTLKKEVRRFNPQYIFHSAAYGGYQDIQQDRDLMIQTNIMGTYNLLEATEDIAYRCFIHAGSSSEYGIKDHAISEEDILEPVDFYGVTKASATLLCQMFAKRKQKNIVILRPFSVYGPYEKSSRLIPYVILKCLQRQAVEITSGEQKRDFIHVDDVINIYLKAMDKRGVEAEIFNVGSGEDISVKEVVRMIFELTESDLSLLKIGARKKRDFEAICSWKADLSRLNHVLGFHPKLSLQEGLKKTIDWIHKNREFYENGRLSVLKG